MHASLSTPALLAEAVAANLLPLYFALLAGALALAASTLLSWYLSNVANYAAIYGSLGTVVALKLKKLRVGIELEVEAAMAVAAATIRVLTGAPERSLFVPSFLLAR